jgi:hypothetical protein
VYDPLNPLENLLGMTLREYKTYDEVPAFKETLSLVKYEGLVRAWLAEKERVKSEEDANRAKNQGNKQTSSESSKLVKGSTATKKLGGSPTTKVSKKRKAYGPNKKTRTKSTV